MTEIPPVTEARHRSFARVATPVPRRYLSQLCKHFDHRLPVEMSDDCGRITFQSGECALKAEQDALVLRIDAASDEARLRTEEVVARHLLRFAFREPPDIVWTAEKP